MSTERERENKCLKVEEGTKRYRVQGAGLQIKITKLNKYTF